MFKPLLFSTLSCAVLLSVGMAMSTAVVADSGWRGGDDWRGDGRHRPDHPRPYEGRGRDSWKQAPRSGHRPDYRSPRPVYPHRPWRGHPGPRPRHYHYRGDDFFSWLAFTAVTLAIIDSLDEQQQREHELSMRRALRAPLGETIRWRDGGAGGSVTTLRDGTSSLGRYCREYTQDVRIGGRSQQVYGTACRNSDGSWDIMEP